MPVHATVNTLGLSILPQVTRVGGRGEVMTLPFHCSSGVFLSTPSFHAFLVVESKIMYSSVYFVIVLL